MKALIFTINLNDVLSLDDLPLCDMKGAQIGIGPMRVFIKIRGSQKSLNLQFGGRVMTSNYQQAAQIARALD